MTIATELLPVDFVADLVIVVESAALSARFEVTD